MIRNILVLQVNIIIVLMFYMSKCGASNSIVAKDTLSSKTVILVNKLDSISTDTIIDLNSNSNKFNVFVNLFQVATQDELLFVVKKHNNPVVRGYAYIGLVVLENKTADAVISKHYSKLSIKVSDVIGICYTSNAFITSIHKKKYRIQRSIQNKEAQVLEEEEKKVIIMENKIREEQGVPKVKVPE